MVVRVTSGNERSTGTLGTVARRANPASYR
jgi:hypothetical protein